MERLGAGTFRQALKRLPETVMPHRRQALLFASVATVVAASVVFAGLCLRVLRETASEQSLMTSGVDGLPDVLDSRCMDQAQERSVGAPQL